MNVVVLGSGAGGGFPQWNCHCEGCTAARSGHARVRSQSSIAVRSDAGPWFLINASPDVRQQLELLGPAVDPSQIRATPIAGIVLTDAEIDHTLGLLLLRESSRPLKVYCTVDVHAALSRDLPLLSVLERYCGVEWTPLVPGETTALDGSSLELDAFLTGGDAPLYMDGASGPGSIGLTIRDRSGGGVLTYAPAIAELEEGLVGRLRSSDCVLADGTFWDARELVDLGLSARTAWDMGHAPLHGPGGTLDGLAGLRRPTILVHLNNTNPVLRDGSEERAAVECRGIEVGYDGMEIAV